MKKLTRAKALDAAKRRLDGARACVLVFCIGFLDGSVSAEKMREVAKRYRDAAGEYHSARHSPMKLLRELAGRKP